MSVVRPDAPNEGMGGALAARLQTAVPELEDVRILRRLTGGSSHETWAFDARLRGLERHDPVPLILRREFDHALFDMSLGTEFELLSRLHETGLPVPRPLFHAGTDTALGSPFMIIERIAGLDTRKVMAAGGGTDRGKIGKSLVAALARLHAQQASLIADLISGDGRDAPARELAKWKAVIAASGDRSATLRIATQWLETNSFTVECPVIVHGDYKANNILLKANAEPVIIDWELAHIGDPVEDLAWTMLWTSPDDLVEGMMTPDEFLSEYEHQTGTTVDRRRLLFWKIFSLVKLAAIFLKGLETPPGGVVPRPTLLMLGQAIPCIEQALGDLLLRELEGSVGP
ncbi:hypothetical protein V475_16000 [Sphingobium baderi LL03]|uniref:Aminoglycoside phosphotransferase domain-containing protein n=1 Tax=Sphingobium baderi LL03 TaxID=1114964 RepID=T0HNZ5_9SPHN|nr:phosphotransferase [Sphingobium baderi]EQB01055.1 hypothetical protein L485_11365 [Sphingobium baderi LL03]KMS61043.1 hypothetical protein V475_16000 [Sphingobium baderi LL03]